VVRTVLIAAAAVLTACGARQEATTLVVSGEVPRRVEVEAQAIGGGLFQAESRGGFEVLVYDLPVPPQQAWTALDPAFQSLGFQGAGAIDVGRRIFGYPDAVFPRAIGGQRPSAFMDCGQSPGGRNADTHRLTGSLVTAVRPSDEPGRSLLEVTVMVAARPREVSGGAVSCASNGRLERLVAHTVTAQALGAL
jgi:hypothetical protein